MSKKVKITWAAEHAIEDYLEQLSWDFLCTECEVERHGRPCPTDGCVFDEDCYKSQQVKNMEEDLREMFWEFENTWGVRE